MSEHETTTGPAADVGLTDVDVERALATTLARGDGLVRRRARRRAALSAVGVVALLAGGFGVLHSLSDDTAAVDVTPSVEGTSVERSTSTVASTTPDLPAGYITAVSSLGVHAVVYVGPGDDVPATSGAGGVALGGGITVSRQTPVVSATVIDETRLRVAFECVRNGADRLESVRYFLRDGQVHLDAEISGGRPGPDCVDGVGVLFDLEFSEGGLPANTRTVVEPVE